MTPSSSPSDPARKVIKLAARVIQVLAFFDERKRSLSVGEIAAQHNWPHSSTSALLSDWVQNDSFKDGQLLRLIHTSAT